MTNSKRNEKTKSKRMTRRKLTVLLSTRKPPPSLHRSPQKWDLIITQLIGGVDKCTLRRTGVHGSDQYHAFQFGLGFGVKRSKREAERRGGVDNSTAQLSINLLAKSAGGVGACPLLLLDRNQPPTPIALFLIKAAS